MFVEVPDGRGVVNEDVGIKDIINRAGCQRVASAVCCVSSSVTVVEHFDDFVTTIKN